MARSGITGSWSSSNISFLRHLHTILHNGCTDLHSYQLCVSSFFHISLPAFRFFYFLLSKTIAIGDQLGIFLHTFYSNPICFFVLKVNFLREILWLYLLFLIKTYIWYIFIAVFYSFMFHVIIGMARFESTFLAFVLWACMFAFHLSLLHCILFVLSLFFFWLLCQLNILLLYLHFCIFLAH
jgi:hypothetical protein